MTHRGRRSLEAQTRRQKKKQKQREREQYNSDISIATSILLRYSWRDKTTGEAVFTDLKCKTSNGETFSFKTLIYNKLKDQFGDGIPPLNHEYGDVLNRFTLKAPPTHTYVFGKGGTLR